ncbi:hypothetical protein [Sulfurimonas sp.]|uniref:hypothetical protein n=1 Tax=Sulfurimonas sp. TaxID=2022749 RepID=UPI002B478A79|nr:hypothetical protein [Sulfurimonas sp.]
MQLAIDIKNEPIADKVLWMLDRFKSDGVEILKLNSKNEKEVINNFREGLEEIKAVNNGNLHSRPVKELLEEL